MQNMNSIVPFVEFIQKTDSLLALFYFLLLCTLPYCEYRRIEVLEAASLLVQCRMISGLMKALAVVQMISLKGNCSDQYMMLMFVETYLIPSDKINNTPHWYTVLQVSYW